MNEEYARAIDELERAALDGPASLSPQDRRTAAFGADLSAPLASYTDTVRRHAYKVVDGDIARLREAGLSEDEIFDATVAAAVGAGLARLRAGLRALEQA